MYRPQFAYPLAKDCWDMRFLYSYDKSNTPYLNTTLAAGAHTGRIPLQMDQDAPFFLRALQQQAVAGLQIRIETPHGEPLSDSGNVIEPLNYVYPNLYSESVGAGFAVAIETEVFCPKGGVFEPLHQ